MNWRGKNDCSMFDVRYRVSVYVAIRRYQRVFCLRFKQYVQNYMHTPRNTNWRCTRAAFIAEESSLSLWLRMNAFWSISLCAYTSMWHMQFQTLFCVYEWISCLFVFVSICVCVCTYTTALHTYISIDSIPSNINIGTNKHNNSSKSSNNTKNPSPIETLAQQQFTEWIWNAIAVEVNFTCSFSDNVNVWEAE